MIDGIPNHGWNMFFFQPRGIPDHFWLRDWSWHASGVGPKKLWLFSFDIRQPFQDFVFQTNKNRQFLNIILIYYMLYDMCNYTYTYAFLYVYIYIDFLCINDMFCPSYLHCNLSRVKWFRLFAVDVHTTWCTHITPFEPRTEILSVVCMYILVQSICIDR